MKHVDSLSRYPQDVFAITSEVAARLKVAQEKDNYIKAIAEILKLQPYENFKLKGCVVYVALRMYSDHCTCLSYY